MEKFGQTTLVAFDKTGTLTEGTPRVAELELVPDESLPPGSMKGLGADEVLALAAGAEQPREHPIAGAVVAAARERDLTVPAAEDFTSTPGRGVIATVAGWRVRVGSPALLT